MNVLNAPGREVDAKCVVDDACPEASGKTVLAECEDRRVKVIFRPENGGGGAVVETGYTAALNDGHDIVVKVDGDGQMDPRLIPLFIKPIVAGRAPLGRSSLTLRTETRGPGSAFVRL